MDDEEAPERDQEVDSWPEREAVTNENKMLGELNSISTVDHVQNNMNLLTEFDKLSPLKKRPMSGQ